MIWYIFALTVFIGLFFIVLGYSTHEILYQYLGYLMLFSMGIVLMGVGVDEFGIDYQTGEILTTDTNETYKYGDNYTGYHWDYVSPPKNGDVNLFHRYVTEEVTSTNVYDTYTNFTIGFYLAVISVLGFILSFFEYKKSCSDIND